jgi:hypothetical protein
MSTTATPYQILIGGELRDAASGETMDVIAPATGETIAEVPRCSAEDVDRAIEAARAAAPGWLEKTPKERSELLYTLADVLEENAEELAQLESVNVGKPLMASRDEMPFSADNLRFFAGAARNLEGKSAGEYIEGYTSMIRREPIGIVGGICPWNYPLMMAVWKMGPALAAGNLQILKPSEQTPLSLLRFVQLAQEVIPPGVLQVVTGDGVPVGQRLVEHPAVGMVSLTGDIETGKTVARNAADTLKRVHLELGGKAPMVIFDDADPEAVAQGIRLAGYWNSGQDCTAGSRVIAGPRIYDKLLDELVPAVESLKVGDPLDDATEMGLGHLARPAAADPRLPRAGQGRDDPDRWRHRSERRLLRPADRRHRREARGRDRPARGVRSCRHGAEVRRRRRGDPLGQRRRLRARRVGVDAGRRPGDERGPEAPVRRGVGQRPPPADLLGAPARRLQAVGLRQGHVDLLHGGVHPAQARRRQDRLNRSAEVQADCLRERVPELREARLTAAVHSDRAADGPDELRADIGIRPRTQATPQPGGERVPNEVRERCNLGL